MNLSPTQPTKFLNLGNVQDRATVDAFNSILKLLEVFQQDVAKVVNANADGTGGLFNLPQYTTAGAPAYVKGSMYFDTTLNKARVGGATGWETITSV